MQRMQAVEKYDSSKSLRDKALYVLSIMGKTSASNVAMEIRELDGVSTEEGVAGITIEVEDVINKLCDEGFVNKLKEYRQKVRYVLP